MWKKISNKADSQHSACLNCPITVLEKSSFESFACLNCPVTVLEKCIPSPLPPFIHHLPHTQSRTIAHIHTVSGPITTACSITHSVHSLWSHWHSNTTVTIYELRQGKGGIFNPVTSTQSYITFLFRCNRVAILVQTTTVVCSLSLNTHELKRKNQHKPKNNVYTNSEYYYTKAVLLLTCKQVP